MSMYIHSDKISPYIRYVNDLKRRGYSDFGERIIYDNELLFCVDGEAKMHMDDGVYTITRGDVFFLRPNLRNRMIVEKDAYFHAHCVHFDWYFIDENLNFTAEDIYIFPSSTAEAEEFTEKLRHRPNADVPELSFPPLIRGTDYDRLLTMFRGMYTAFRDNTVASNLKMRGLFFEALSELTYSRDISYSSTEHTHRHMINKVTDYISQHYMEDITVPQLAGMVGMSGKYFGVIFKRITGKTVSEYITQVRMQKAEDLLLKTTLSLDKIAEEIGVSDEYYIVKLFKKYKGITPGRYRRMLFFDNEAYNSGVKSPDENGAEQK